MLKFLIPPFLLWIHSLSGFQLPSDPPVSFKKDVMPIIKANCTINGCHNGDDAPEMETYDQIRRKRNKIRARLIYPEKMMPPADSGIMMTEDEISTLKKWVEEGAQNN